MSARISDIPNRVEVAFKERAPSQAKLIIDNGDDDNGDDGISYHSFDAEDEAVPDQKEEEKPKPKQRDTLKPKLDEAVIREFIRANIFQRHCSSFIPSKESKELCQCGLKTAGHDPSTISHSSADKKQKWDADTCTRKVSSSCYGFVNFDGFGQEASRKVPYVRVDHQTEVPHLWELLKTCWKLPEPKLIISITGGAKRLFIKSRLMNSFRRGLINAVTAADAWIVTGGTNTGVMEIVGDAVHEYTLQMGGMGRRIVVLGIATWGYVANKTSLKVPEDDETQTKTTDNSTTFVDGSLPGKNLSEPPGVSVPDIIPLSPIPSGQDGTPLRAEIVTADQIPSVMLKVLHRAIYKFDDLRLPENQGHVALNPFHTHFILVDNGTNGKPGFEINLRANLEQYIVKQCEGQVVLLVLEGGEKTLETAAEAIDRNTPIVVIKGSGRAADVIAHAYYKYKSLTEKTKGLDKDSELKAKLAFDEDVKAKATKAFDWAKETDPDVLKKRTKTGMKHLNNILQKMHLVVIYNLEDSNGETTEMDQSILKALLQAQPNDTQSQLGLALAWNCCEVARQEIFSLETRLQWQKIDLHSSMHTAIVENKIDFAQLFMDNGVNLKNFLTIKRLEQLYRDVLEDGRPDSCTEILKNLISEQQKQFCLCCGTKSNSDDDDFSLEIVGNVINKLTSDQQENVYNDLSGVCKDNLMPYPERELFYFALLLGRKEMAIHFWRCCRDHIGGALTASVLCRSLALIAENEEELDLHQELCDSAVEFESYAVGVLNQCYQLDKHLAHMLLTRELDLWGNRTLFMIADGAEQMDFMEQSCCQTQLNKSWTGRMAAHTPSWKIIFGLVFLTIPLIKFTKEQKELRQVDQDGETEEDEETDGHFYSVGLTTNKQKNRIGIFLAIYLFLMSPLVKFCYYAISQVIYIGLFSFFLLTDLRPIDEPDSPGVCEIIIWIWTLTLILEEVRQIFASESFLISAKVLSYFGSRWNQFDVVIYLLFIVAFTLRLALNDERFDWARIVYTITLLLFFVRLLQYFFVHKDIGPKVIILGGMMTDLLLFILLLAIFVVSYGIAARVLLYPNATPSWNILVNILYQPYFQLYGAVNQDEALGIRDNTCPSNDSYYNEDPTSERCPKTSWLVVVLLSIELLLANVLLMNLLIAMFSYTFTVIQENSEKVWRYYRYSLIYEYYSKPILAPPLIIFIHIWRLGKNAYYRCFKPDHKIQHHFRRSLMIDENKKLTAVERHGMENHMIKRQKALQDMIDFKIASTSEKVEKMVDDIEQLKEQLNSHKDVRNLVSPSSPATSTSLVTLNAIEVTGQPAQTIDLAAINAEHTTSKAVAKSDLSAIHKRLDHTDEILNKLLDIVSANPPHQHSNQQRRSSRLTPPASKTLPKVD